MSVIFFSEITESTKSMSYLALSLITMQLIMLENLGAIDINYDLEIHFCALAKVLVSKAFIS